MHTFVNQVARINGVINEWVWGIPMLILIISTGIWMSIRTGFFQIVRAKIVGDETFFAIFKKRHVTKTKDKKAISQFQALSTALAATIGTGNIAGVATALTIGGPGAIFWMWVSVIFGMMTNFLKMFWVSIIEERICMANGQVVQCTIWRMVLEVKKE